MTHSDRYSFEFPDQAGYPDGTGTLTQDQVVLIDHVVDDPQTPAFDFYVVNLPDQADPMSGSYSAIVGAVEIGSVTYRLAGDRIVIVETFVYPEHRRQGIATELIRRVLDDVRSQGKTVTVLCPIARTFVDHHPDYADLLDPQHPGVTHRGQPAPRRSAPRTEQTDV